MKYVKYLAAKVILRTLSRLTAGRAYTRQEGRLFVWACLAHARWVYRHYGATGAGRKVQPIVVE